MELGKKLKYFRESKKMSIYRLALEADISQDHLSDPEKGKNQTTIDTLKRLLIPLDITLTEFFNEDNEIWILTHKETEYGMIEYSRYTYFLYQLILKFCISSNI